MTTDIAAAAAAIAGESLPPGTTYQPNRFGDGLIFDFPNGRTASVLKRPDSTGRSGVGLFEVAVMLDGELDYSTPITRDVVGWLEPDEVRGVLFRIAALPRPYGSTELEG